MRIVKQACLVLSLAVVCAWNLSAQTAPAAGPPSSAAAPAAERAPGLYMTFQTDMGNISCSLFEKEAPKTVRIMVGLAIGKMSYIDPTTKVATRKKFFDGLVFHRVIPGFMIQGGDPLGNGMGSPLGPGFPYDNEVAPGLQFNVPGRLAMANTGRPNSDGSQFFITEVPYPSLNGGYTIWGQCDNVDVVKAITHVPRDDNDRPKTPVHIKHVVVERVGPAPVNAPEAMPARPASSGTGAKPAGAASGTASGAAGSKAKTPPKPVN